MTIRIYWLLLLLIVQRSMAQTPSPARALLQQIANSKPDTSRIDLLVQLGSYYLFKPGSYKTDLDSSLDYFNQALQLSKTLHTKKRELEILKLIGDSYLEGSDLANGKMYFKQVTDYYHQLGNIKQEVDTWIRLADCIRFERGAFNAEKLRALEYSQSLLLEVRDTLTWFHVLHDIALVHLTEGDLAQAEREFLQAIAGYKALHYPFFYYAYDRIAEASRQQGSLERTIRYRLQAVQSMEAAGDTVVAASYYNKLSVAYIEAGQRAKSLEYLKKAKARLIREKITGYHQAGNTKQEARGWVAVGDNLIDDFPAAIDEKLSCYENAQRLFHQLRDTLNEAETLRIIGINYLVQGKPALAERALLQAIDQFKLAHFPKLHPSYCQLGQAYRLQGNFYKELYYNIEAIKNMQALADTGEAYRYYLNMALTYQNLDMPEKSLYYNRQAWQAIQQMSDHISYYLPALQIVSRLIALNRTPEALNFIQKTIREHPPKNLSQKANAYMAFAHCYKALNDYPKAEYYYLQMIHAADTVLLQRDNLFENYVVQYRVIVNFYLQNNQYAKAALYLNKLPDLSGCPVSPFELSQLQYFRFKIDSAAGNYQSAMRHLVLHKNLDDSIFTATKSQQINNLNIRYETDKKQDSIQLQAKDIQLLRNQEQLQAGKVQQSVFTRNVWIGGCCMLLLLLGVVYNRYRLKKRSNLLLEEQKQDISAKNTRLELLLRDNEWLLREVHHRVKNNLQLVMSLLNSQSTYLQDEAALHAVLDSQHRVQSMSLIHQKLYKTDNVSSIYMPEYIRDLVDYLKSSFKTKASLYFDLQIESIDLDVLHAVPVGLILNEAITNALKYAFTEGDENTIRIRLFREGEETITLVVADNGRGLPAGFDTRNNNSFGMILMQGLTEDLGGHFNITSDQGTFVSMTFNNARVYKNRPSAMPENRKSN